MEAVADTQSNNRTRVKASEDRAEAFRLSVGGSSLEEIVFHFAEGKGDEGATLDRVRHDIRSIKREDLVPDDPEGLAHIVFLQDILAKAQSGWDSTKDISFLHLALAIQDDINGESE